jgi:hypothetical protein
MIDAERDLRLLCYDNAKLCMSDTDYYSLLGVLS